LVGVYCDTELEWLPGVEWHIPAMSLLVTPVPVLLVIDDDTSLIWPRVEVKIDFVSTFQVERKPVGMHFKSFNIDIIVLFLNTKLQKSLQHSFLT
jgi:hypothetical protein